MERKKDTEVNNINVAPNNGLAYMAPKIEEVCLDHASLLQHPSYPVDTCASFEALDNEIDEWESDN